MLSFIAGRPGRQVASLCCCCCCCCLTAASFHWRGGRLQSRYLRASLIWAGITGLGGRKLAPGGRRHAATPTREACWPCCVLRAAHGDRREASDTRRQQQRQQLLAPLKKTRPTVAFDSAGRRKATASHDEAELEPDVGLIGGGVARSDHCRPPAK